MANGCQWFELYNSDRVALFPRFQPSREMDIVQMKHLHYIMQACVSRAQVQMGPSSLPPMIEKYKEENNYKRCLFTLRCRLVRTSSGQRTRQKISKIVQQKKVYAFIKRTNIKRNHQRMEHFCRNKKQTLVVY